MESFAPVVAAALAIPAGWSAGAFQHLLYRESAFKADKAQGRKALVIRAGLSLAAAAATALAFRPGHYDLGPALLTALFAIVFLVLASTDFERRRIPDRLSYPAISVAAAVCWAWPDRTIIDVFAGGGFGLGVGAALFGLGLFAGGAGGLGLGDVKLMLLIGLVLGWPAVMYALIYGMIIAAVPSVALILMRRGNRYFAYGPYLALGALVVLLWPDPFT